VFSARSSKGLKRVRKRRKHETRCRGYFIPGRIFHCRIVSCLLSPMS